MTGQNDVPSLMISTQRFCSRNYMSVFEKARYNYLYFYLCSKKKIPR